MSNFKDTLEEIFKVNMPKPVDNVSENVNKALVMARDLRKFIHEGIATARNGPPSMRDGGKAAVGAMAKVQDGLEKAKREWENWG